MKPPFDPSTELLKWGPVPGTYLYIAGDYLEAFFVELGKRYDHLTWPETVLLLHNEKILWLNDYATIREVGKRVFFEYILLDDQRQKLERDWEKAVAALSVLEAELDALDLSTLDDQTLIEYGTKFYAALIDYWCPTFFPEIGNYGIEKYLEEELSKVISSSAEVARAMEILTAPEELSFYQVEEIDLVKTKDMEEHQRSYFWLQNNLHESIITPVSYFEERKKKLAPGLEKTIYEGIETARQRKAELKRKYSLDPELLKVAHLMIEGVLWQDRRKKHTFKSIHYKKRFLEEIARRKSSAPEELYVLDFKELLAFLESGLLPPHANERSHWAGFHSKDGSIQKLTASESEELWDLYAKTKVEDANVETIRGVLASVGGGTVQGHVRILLDPKDSLEEGEILVTSMTSPEFIFAMRNAAAIITDEGGITSHAAIVSRELKKPCIIGTKIATQVLKNGDVVEVDVSKGVVRIVSRA